MPFFRGVSNAFLRTAAAGWSLSGIASIQTGSPVNVTITQDQDNSGQGSQRPNLVGKIDASRCGKVLVACVNSNTFALPAQYTYGNAGRSLFYGPGLFNNVCHLPGEELPHRRAIRLPIPAGCVQHAEPRQLGQSQRELVCATFGNITSAGAMRAFELTGRLVF